MKKLYIILPFIITSCVKQQPFKKPFVILDKNINAYSDNRCLYQYQDANGRTCDFCDTNEKYNIGDTIK